MLTKTDLRALVDNEIRELLLETESEIEAWTGQEGLVELGLNSLLLARLLIQLEAALGVDPFADESVAIWDIQSVNDLVAVYERALASIARGET
jgi:acyl carrier protein